ncbi:astacin-like metalloendopeptidase [Pelodytes ibericus]
MALSMILVLIAAGWSISHALPVQINDGVAYELSKDQNIEDKKFFELIETKNKEVIRPLTEGDIAIKLSRSVINCQNCFWPPSPDGSVYVPYIISSAYTTVQRDLITDALNEIQLMSCVRFVGRTTEVNYLSIESGSGCWSYIAMTGGKQTVSLAQSGCMAHGIIQHEVMHALGFLHEHTRSDRDSYVDIIWQYISLNDRSHFKIDVSNNLDLPYDYSSVMHYENTAFTNTGGQSTIIPKPDPTVPIGQRVGMSYLDVKKMNKLYNCTVCRTKLQEESGNFSADGLSFGQDGSCLWLIQVAPNSKVYLQLSDFSIPPSAGCSASYIRVYDGNSRSANVLLDKTCGNAAIPPLISSYNNMLIEFGSNQAPDFSTFSAAYEAVSYGQTFTTSKGILVSPQFSRPYPNNVDALWSIIAPPQYKISLRFMYLLVQDSPTCQYDYITVIDGPTTTSPVLGKFCGNKLPSPVMSTGNVMLVQFRSDDQINFKGFYLCYQFGRPMLVGAGDDPVVLLHIGTNDKVNGMSFL